MFKVGDYIISRNSLQVSIVIDKREGVDCYYRTNVILDRHGRKYSDDRTNAWVKLSPEHVRLLTDLEKELL